MPNEKYSLFESVVHITEERDKKSLEQALVKTLSDYIDFDALILLRLPSNTDNKYVEVAVSMPTSATRDKLEIIPHEFGDQRAELDADLTSCVDKGEIVSSKQGHSERTLFPILVNNVVSGVLDIYGHHSTTKTERIIDGFIRIYSNFQSIINDNEHDTLTGLLNRKTFDAQLSGLLLAASIEKNDLICTGGERRTSKKVSNHWVGLLDIDHFKSINDNFGHVYGDEVLLLFSDLMRKVFRSGDLLFRYGGEEFVVVLSPASDLDAFNTFDRFRRALETFDFPQVGRVTVSAGMVKVGAQEHPATVLEHADKALYYSKDHGRNQVSNYHELVTAGKLKERYIEGDIELF